MTDELLVFTSVPDEETAERISRLLVENRLAACVTQTAAGTSVYWWEGKVTREREIILFIKTQAKCYSELEKTLAEDHPYTVPEIIAVPIIHGLDKYLDWLHKETGPDR